MDTKRHLAKYFKKHLNAVRKLLRRTDEQWAPEDFHQLRVEIKKIRAFVTMLKSSTKKFNSGKVIKPLKKIFHQAGKVRQVQLVEETLQRLDLDGRLQLFHQVLHFKKLKEKIDFTVIQDRFRKAVDKTDGRITPFIEKINADDIKKYIEGSKKEVGSLLNKKILEPKQVHELRKGLKKLYYNLKSLKLLDDRVDFKNGKSLQKLMGEWHDMREVARDLLTAGRNRITTPVETRTILKTAHQLDAKSLQLYKKINLNKRKKIF